MFEDQPHNLFSILSPVVGCTTSADKAAAIAT
jgi:hypothetical protein